MNTSITRKGLRGIFAAVASAALASALMVAPAFASSEFAVDEDDPSVGTAETDVNVTVTGKELSVTVPLTLAVATEAGEGEISWNYTANNFKIVNNKDAAKITKMLFEKAEGSYYNLMAESSYNWKKTQTDSDNQLSNGDGYITGQLKGVWTQMTPANAATVSIELDAGVDSEGASVTDGSNEAVVTSWGGKVLNPKLAKDSTVGTLTWTIELQ